MLIKDFKCPSCGFDLSTYDIPVMSVSEIMTEVAVCPECGKEIEIPKPSTSQGITLGEFTLESKIGSGGMGEVWLAHQISLGRKAAVKILFPSFAQNPDYVARFIQEARLSANLSHPNIVTTFSAGDDRGLKYMASEFIEGEDLEQKIEHDGAIPEKEALDIARHVASALDYAWNRSKLLHRDIKPANIMIDREGLVKLMDMGISKSLDAVSSMTMTGTMVGTPHYMSIEQAMGKKDLDFRSDEYSLGATLYHMVAGAVPFEAETTMAVLMRHVNDPLPSPKDKNPTLSDQCVALIEIMMAKSPDNRHKSWKDLIADIDLVLAGKYPGAVPRPSPSATMVGKAIEIPHRKAMKIDARSMDDSFPAPKPAKGRLLPVSITIIVVLAAAALLFYYNYKYLPGSGKNTKTVPVVKSNKGVKPSAVPAPKPNLDRKDFPDIAAELEVADLLFNSFNWAQSIGRYEKLLGMIGGKSRKEQEKLADTASLAGKRILDAKFYAGRDKLGGVEKLRVVRKRLSEDNGFDVPLDEKLALRMGMGGGGMGTPLYFCELRNLRDISALRGMTEFGTVDLSYTGVTDLSPLSGLKPRWLNLTGTNISTINCNMQGVQMLTMDNCKNISNLEFLRDFTFGDASSYPQTSISIANTSVRDISPLRGKSFQHINLKSSQVEDIGPLAGMDSLVSLNLGGLQGLKDISVLMKLPKLSSITLPAHILNSDISFLKAHPALKNISVDDGRKFTTADFWPKWEKNKCADDPVPAKKEIGTGLIAYYPFTNNSNDASGNGFDLPPPYQKPPPLTADRSGKANNAYSLFHGDPQAHRPSISYDLSSRLGTGSFAVSFGFCPGGIGMSGKDIILGGLSATGYGAGFSIGFSKREKADGDCLYVYQGNSSYPGNENGRAYIESKKSFTSSDNGKWADFAVVWDDASKVCSLYVDGVLDNSQKFPAFGRELISQTRTIGLGRDASSNYYPQPSDGKDAVKFEDKIDDLRIYNRALAAEEIRKLYDAGSSPEQVQKTSTTASSPAPWNDILKNANTAYDGKKWKEASDLYQKAVDEMIKDTGTASDVLTKQLATAQGNLGECRSQIEKTEAVPETNTEIKYTRADILELFKNINPKWKQSFLEADSAYRGKKSKSSLISYRKLSQDIINDTTTNQDITARALSLAEDRIRELENPAPAKSSPGYLDNIQGEVNTKVKSNKPQEAPPDKKPQK